LPDFIEHEKVLIAHFAVDAICSSFLFWVKLWWLLLWWDWVFYLANIIYRGDPLTHCWIWLIYFHIRFWAIRGRRCSQGLISWGWLQEPLIAFLISFLAQFVVGGVGNEIVIIISRFINLLHC
jgi:hypothetical protein